MGRNVLDMDRICPVGDGTSIQCGAECVKRTQWKNFNWKNAVVSSLPNYCTGRSLSTIRTAIMACSQFLDFSRLVHTITDSIQVI